jgi:hypothetical protein
MEKSGQLHGTVAFLGGRSSVLIGKEDVWDREHV